MDDDSTVVFEFTMEVKQVDEEHVDVYTRVGVGAADTSRRVQRMRRSEAAMYAFHATEQIKRIAKGVLDVD